MNGNTIRYIRTEGEKLLKGLHGELYLNIAGARSSANTRAIFDSHRDFEEPDLFRSLKEITVEDKDGKARNRLIQAFLADSFLGAKASGLADRILSLEAGEVIAVGKKRIPLRAADAEIVSEPKKHKRDEILSRRNEKLKKLLPLLQQKLALTTETSEILGFPDYSILRDEIDGLGIALLIEQAKLLLRDTDYVSREMFGWFFPKVIDMKLADASIHDMACLLNAGELRGYFPAKDIMSISRQMLEECGLSSQGSIKLDMEKRKGKAAGCFCFPLNPPREIAASIYPEGGVRDYESYLKCWGHSLCYAFTEADDDFEIRFLREEALVGVFSGLFGNLIYEPKWLKKYLRIDTEGDFLRFLYLRRLMSARIAAANTIYESELYKNPDSAEMPGLFRGTMENASHCKVNESEYLAELARPLGSVSLFKGILIEPVLGHFLKESFDEEWWRMPEAGDFLKGIWRDGGRISTEDLSKKIGSGGPDTVMISRVFEKALG